jgi:two-component system C4-dicarboxylate transport sensor histidine kinase DctB
MSQGVRGSRTARIALIALAVGFIVASAALSHRVWRENGLRSLEAIGEQRVQLLATAIQAEINRQDHLPVLLSLDSHILSALAAPNDPQIRRDLNIKLQRIGAEADTRALYVMGRDGTVIASQDFSAPDGLVGRNLSAEPYFQRALEAGRSAELVLDPESLRFRYFLAERVGNNPALGVIGVRIEFERLEDAWKRAGEHVLVTGQNCVVFLATNMEHRNRVFSLSQSAGGRDNTACGGNVGGEIPFETVEQRPSGVVIRLGPPGQTVSYLHEGMLLPEHKWTIHRLADLSGIETDQRDGTIIGATLSALLISLLLYLVQRHRAYVAARAAGTKLKEEVAERTRELQEANSSLQVEIDERRRTEARLRSTQNELVQAGKLAALGQMSAAIAHEINQPLAAIRTFIASTKIFVQRGEAGQVTRNIDLINDLAERMARITAHLKTFARKSDAGRPEPVNVQRAMRGALFLMENQINSAGVTLTSDVPSDLWVMGHAVQLEQVLVNLVRNALDAVTGVEAPRIEVRGWTEHQRVLIGIVDNGPGIPADVIDRIFDPFVTTKPVGKGLGLGLSISYGIVQDFHGRLRASNRPGGGAELVVELPRALADYAQLAQASHG